MNNKNWEKARTYFRQNDPRIKAWEDNNIVWVLHHKDLSWKTDDIDRYNEWNIDDLLPMTLSAHAVIHHTGKHRSDETRCKMSKALKHRKFSDESRKRMSEAHKNIKVSDETKQKIRDGNLGKKVSEETKKKISDTKTGHTVTEETRRKMSESHKKHVVSEETRRKMSESHKRKNRK